ncbi:MAG: hypothetical protein KBC64_01510 [Simkaniaceae bacterium]|nr:hypothetical protein [Simkaniaceae bacterium]
MFNKYVLRLLFVFYNFSAIALTHRPESILISAGPAQREVAGVIYNLDNFIHLAEYFGLQLDEYGANSTVDYLVPVFPDNISTFENSLPQIVMNKNDVILIEVTVPDTTWLNTHSLFNITPYFYFYEADGTKTSVYASENITIQFFELFDTPGDKIRICITPNKTIAAQYENLGYMISGMPEEYLNSTTFQILFRVGTINGEQQLSINNFVKVTFLEATEQAPFAGSDYFDAAEIIASFPTELAPASPSGSLAEYGSIVAYLQTQSYTTYQCVKYLSNIYSTNYAFNNFYKAISVNPAAEMQANNTGENYFNSPGVQSPPNPSSAFIDLSIQSGYLYILSLNQHKMKAGLTSNVQIYNEENLAIIPNGLIITSPDLPPFSAPNYPYIASIDDPYPLFQINAYNIADLTESEITQVIITERISYNPVNFYQSSNEYAGKAYFFFGTLTSDQVSYLYNTFGITITYP